MGEYLLLENGEIAIRSQTHVEDDYCYIDHYEFDANGKLKSQSLLKLRIVKEFYTYDDLMEYKNKCYIS